MKSHLLRLCLIVLPLIFGRVALGQPTHEEAKLHFQKGVELFTQGNLTGALAEFEGSYKLNPVPEVLFNIALTQKALGRNADALETVQRFIHEAEGRPGGMAPKRRADAEKTLTEIKGQLASLTVSVQPPGATLTIDGKPHAASEMPIYLDPGTHYVDVSATGLQTAHRTVVAVAGKGLQFAIDLRPHEPPPQVATAPVAPPPAVVTPPAPPAEPAPPGTAVAPAMEARPSFVHTTRGKATIALGTLSGALLLTGAILGGVTVSTHSDYHQGCLTACDQSLYDKGHGTAVATDVLLTLGGVGAVTTLIVALVHPRPHNYALAPVVSTHSLGLGFSGSF